MWEWARDLIYTVEGSFGQLFQKIQQQGISNSLKKMTDFNHSGTTMWKTGD